MVHHGSPGRAASAGLVIVLAAAGSSCQRSHAADQVSSGPPPGEVWMTPGEVRDAHIEVATLGAQDVEDSLLTGGTVSLDDLRTAHVFSPVTGRVVRIGVDLGQRVKKGDVLAVLESPDVGSAVSDVNKASADATAAAHDLQRKKDLLAHNAASQADVETAEDTYRTATAELERARQKQLLLHAGNFDAVTQTYTLTSPIDGEVLVRSINPGLEVQGQYSGGSAPELFTIGELDHVWVLGDVYEVDVGRVHVGAAARVSVVAYPDRSFDGRVDWVSGALDPNTRTAKVRCVFDNPDRALKPSMYASVRIAVAQRTALAVPRAALLRLGEYDMVFVQTGQAGDDGGRVRFERLPVDVIRSDGPWFEVRHGLEMGQKIVVSGAAQLSKRL
jgi:cobalt-zinc-cadmium efflux system membrane fusion protein